MGKSKFVAGAMVLFALIVPLALHTSERADAAPAKPSAAKAFSDSSDVQVDHQIHAGQYQIPCRFCHAYADKARVAGIPSLRKCMGCHKFAGKDKRGVRQLAQLFQAGQSPKFNRINDLPDYVYFSHRVHVHAGVQCAACHGAVEKMHSIVSANNFTMGFCTDCHRKRGASLDCVACHQ